MKNTSTKNDTAIEIDNASPLIRVLAIGTCPTVSNKSQLTYHIGCTEDHDIQIRVFANSGAGYHHKGWVPLREINRAFDRAPNDKPLTSFILHSIFEHKSVNTLAFTMSVLKAEGLVRQAGEKSRGYERNDGKEFMAKVQALITSGVDLKIEEKPKKANAKTEAKNNAKAVAGSAKSSKVTMSEAKPNQEVASNEVASSNKGETVTPALPADKVAPSQPAASVKKAKPASKK